MNMVRLIYISHFTRSINPNDVQDILTTSRHNNEKWGITGVLCYDPNCIMQCLEGPRNQVNQLYNHIVADSRHQDVTLLEYADIHQRVFEKWSMAYVNLDELTEPILLKYSPTKHFDPFALTAQQALGLIKEIALEREHYLAQQAAELLNTTA